MSDIFSITTELEPQHAESGLKGLVNSLSLSPYDPKAIYKHIQELIPKVSGSTGEGKAVYRSQLDKALGKAIVISGLENHYPLSDTVSNTYKPMVIEMANQLIDEYDCKTASERALAELVAGSYIRYLECSIAFNNCLRVESLDKENNKYYSMLGKEVDRSHRQFLSALSMLKQIKSPPIQFNIKTNTAFVSQNQQINAIENSSPKGLLL